MIILYVSLPAADAVAVATACLLLLAELLRVSRFDSRYYSEMQAEIVLGMEAN